ncbi:MAG: SDR family NAD(P)-dependent oxidoreductase [Bdellovibrionales bacterium]
METVVILGASRGLGASLSRLAAKAGNTVLGWSRKKDRLEEIQRQSPTFSYRIADFSVEEDQTRVLEELGSLPFDKLFYVAGGGPFGPFHSKSWAAHDWALEVSFRFPARILHLLANRQPQVQTVIIGSSVAEAAPDPGAASYCAAKHALNGLVKTLQVEYPQWDLRLFSPGYMDTELLPVNAAVRNLGVHDLELVAQDLWRWSLTEEHGGHKMHPKHP